MLRHLALLAAVAVWSGAPARAQLVDQTSLNGTYNVRYLGVNTDPADTAVSFSGQITFDGKGGFTVTGQGTTGGAALKYRTSGAYQTFSSGMVYLDNPFDANTRWTLYGGLGANGVIVASSTDTYYCDLFVAIPAATSASASTLNGTYRVAHMEFLNGDTAAGTRNAWFTIAPNGQGSLGNVSLAGTAQALKNAATTQSITGATYTMTANGTGTLVYPAPSGVTAANTLLSGNKILYVSQDGSFFVAGSQNGYDMEIGVKPSTTAPNGIFWNAYLENDQRSSDPNNNGIYSGQGSANENASAGNAELAHQRINVDGYFSYDSAYSSGYNFDANGVSTFTDYQAVYAIGANGSVMIGNGLTSRYRIEVYVKAPAMTRPSGNAPFIDPQGIVNSASSAPITTQIAPGEFLTITGAGLGPSTLTVAPSLPMPTTLGGVQVFMSWSNNPTGTAIPIYYVSDKQIAVITPYNAPTNGDPVTFWVQVNGQQSNKVTAWSGPSSPGIFMAPTADSPYAGAIQRYPNYDLITSSNRAKAGDTLILYMTGLGGVTGNVAAGEAISGTSTVVRKVDVWIDGQLQAPVDFKGINGFGGFYQMNIRVPSGLDAGEHIIEITSYLDDGITPDSDSFEATFFTQ
jgi:uncharacterized protein (TIGR03437 family)